MNNQNDKIWYALQTDSEDDWSAGSYNFEDAKEMLYIQGKGLIAKIVNGVCEKEFYYDDLF